MYEFQGRKTEKLKQVLNEFKDIIISYEETKSPYTSQTIPKKESTTHLNLVKSMYNNMKKIEKEYSCYKGNKLQVYLKQVKLLESFEDDFDEVCDSSSYDRTYFGMDINEFRTYFSWRTKIRKNIIELTDVDYVYIYINELLNGTGSLKDINDILENLICFWTNYRKVYNYIDKIMPSIIKDFYILHDFDIEYSKIVERFPIKDADMSINIKDILTHNYNDKLQIINEISSYKILKSKFLETKYAYMLQECLAEILTNAEKYFTTLNINIFKILVGIEEDNNHWWEPLYNFTVPIKKNDNRIVVINNVEKYECNHGLWSTVMYKFNTNYRGLLGYILKYMESSIRNYLGYRTIKAPNISDILETSGYYSKYQKVLLQKIAKSDLVQVMDETIDNYLKTTKVQKNIMKLKKEFAIAQEEYVPVEITFNTEKFNTIRKVAEETQKSLIVENNEEEEIIVSAASKNEIQISLDVPKSISNDNLFINPENVFVNLISSLTDNEKNVIIALLNETDSLNKIQKIAHTQNELPELMISNINDKALQFVGDNIIESDMSGIFEEYKNDFVELVKGGCN